MTVKILKFEIQQKLWDWLQDKTEADIYDCANDFFDGLSRGELVEIINLLK